MTQHRRRPSETPACAFPDAPRWLKATSAFAVAWKTGQWGAWRFSNLPFGLRGGNGWCKEIRSAHANELYAVLVRPVRTEWGLVQHCAIRTASNLEPPWRDKQRIKNELFGPEYTAVEVMPPDAELIDQADMYHMWVLPPEMALPFTIFDRNKEARAA